MTDLKHLKIHNIWIYLLNKGNLLHNFFDEFLFIIYCQNYKHQIVFLSLMCIYVIDVEVSSFRLKIMLEKIVIFRQGWEDV